MMLAFLSDYTYLIFYISFISLRVMTLVVKHSPHTLNFTHSCLVLVSHILTLALSSGIYTDENEAEPRQSGKKRKHTQIYISPPLFL